jgi:hypothetical protein
VSVRFSIWVLIGATITMLGCKKLNSPYCDSTDQCNGGTCLPSHLCSSYDGGAGGRGAGGMAGTTGGAAGGRPPFRCADNLCPATTPICDMDAGACEACSTNAACLKLNAVTAFCAPESDGSVSPPKGTCVGCLASTDCLESAKPICDTKTWACSGCGTSDACKALNLSTPVCVTASDGSAGPKIGMCVGCLSNANCGGVTPICNLSTNVCTACGSDSDCGAVGPGVCMTDGHCAGTTEVFFVDESAATCPGTGTGSSSTPFCSLPTGAGALAKGQNVLVIRGAVGERLVLATSQVSPVIIGRQNAAGDAAVIPASNGAGISVSSDSVLIRDITVSGGLQSSNTRGVLATGSAAVSLLRVTVNLGNGLGIDAETGTTLSMDRCYVENSSLGGILVNGATAAIQNTIIVANGGTTGYGIQFNAPGNNTAFTFNTVVGNPTAAISDLNHQVFLNNSIVVGPTTNCMLTNSLTIAPPFSSTTLYHLTAHAACPAAPQSPFPSYDIDGQPRVAPVDCGADQFVSP